MTSLLALTIMMAFIASAEGALWNMFTRKMRGIELPHEADASTFRFFTVGRVRLLALVHTALLLLLTVIIFSSW